MFSGDPGLDFGWWDIVGFFVCILLVLLVASANEDESDISDDINNPD